jgi:hypothetical protein
MLSLLLDEFRAQYGIGLTRVGVMTAERGLLLVHADGSEAPLFPQAFDHFHS